MSQTKIIELRVKAARALLDSKSPLRAAEERRLDEYTARVYQQLADTLEFADTHTKLPQTNA
ncbi:hypothetical protein GJW-30_1_02034 [Variibacter gotjawalensis]|uniref:Uncharacterized protein n=1 Tax=Variibacter gotjawalensis TaxID=1333996 RepID=A0A0S3PUB1_9BRAD|nr:hypothetical protein [Variibacter gotjawalensis]NIK49824.1 hypothetical protein [Variibacter gotjawalensis]RZS45826.1 hypothetical protein EV661_4151 [Variibacter gotjawalensis]BAT59501.1 hypothetical protein GJW-30_1_02034 [Variibacter gotjawalensis]